MAMMYLKEKNDIEIFEGKSFSDLVGADAISQITAAFNGFKAISAELVQTLGPKLEVIGGAFGFIAKSSEYIFELKYPFV